MRQEKFAPSTLWERQNNVAYKNERWVDLVYDIAFATADAITGILAQIDAAGEIRAIDAVGTAE